MKIILSARDAELEKAWRDHCGDLENVNVHAGSILDVGCDAVVSPANSFCFMDGGIDALYTQRFGCQVQDRLRRKILEQHHGELIVGNAEIVETGDASIPFLIAAPTMRVPMVLERNTVNPYLAARAVLLLVRHARFTEGKFAGSEIAGVVNTIAFPGLGTGVGRVGFHTCARQVRAAIEEVLLDRFSMPCSWAEASERHQLLYTDRPTRLQY
jgi:O-acetyl-ADP-ribose deacetylase (regulator of RNase III)